MIGVRNENEKREVHKRTSKLNAETSLEMITYNREFVLFPSTVQYNPCP